jgi:hypothetical protein
MKKAMSFGILVSGIMIAAFILFQSQPVHADKNLSQKGENTSMPDSVKKFVDKTCMDCHSTDGNGMARSHVNFSVWDTYSTEKQADKAKDISKVVSKGAMPPKGFKKNHPDLVPTDADVAMIARWANSFKK